MFNNSLSDFLTTYQNILSISSMGYKKLFNITRNTMKSNNCLHAIPQCSRGMEYCRSIVENECYFWKQVIYVLCLFISYQKVLYYKLIGREIYKCVPKVYSCFFLLMIQNPAKLDSLSQFLIYYRHVFLKRNLSCYRLKNLQHRFVFQYLKKSLGVNHLQLHYLPH